MSTLNMCRYQNENKIMLLNAIFCVGTLVYGTAYKENEFPFQIIS